jgi:CHASE2 domain-containing protein
MDILGWLRSRPWFASIVTGAALSFLAFWAASLGIASQKDSAIDNYIAVATQYLRIGPPKDLAVVLIDQDALKEWRVDWPISYDKIADLIHELACARTKGVFFDFSASRRFNPQDSDKGLRESVEDSSRGANCPDGNRPDRIPVFFGKIEGVDGPSSAWLEGQGKTFLLNAAEQDGIYQSGKEVFPARALPIKEVTPAFGLMWEPPLGGDAVRTEDAATCRDQDPRPACWRAPLTMQWNAGLDPEQKMVSRTLGCRGDPGALGLLLGLAPWADHDERFESCPPVLTLRALDLERDLDYIAANGDPARHLVGRFVFVGVDLPGLNDTIATPVHDHLPGVYKHAVALGELLHYRAGYPTLPRPAALYVLVAAIYLMLEAAREATRDRPGQHWMFAAAFLAVVGGFAVLAYQRDWPASLIVVIFGNYVAVTIALFLAWRARARARSSGAPAQGASVPATGVAP